MDSARPHFTKAGVRWSCSDVAGVTKDSDTADDRGQEYCEYYSMIHTPGIPALVMNGSDPVSCSASTPCATGSCDDSVGACVTGTTVDQSQPAKVYGKNLDPDQKVTPIDPKLTPGQLEWLSINGDAKVGECMFTSWHGDIDRAPCSGTQCATVGGYRIDAMTPGTKTVELMKMMMQFNTNGAAKRLVMDCVTAAKSADQTVQAIQDPFMRACTITGTGAGLAFRKSDPSVCLMAMRMVECGCEVQIKSGSGYRTLDLTIPTDPEAQDAALDVNTGTDLAIGLDLFVPEARRGFTLGTWDGIGKLPGGCEYVRTSDPQNIEVGKLPFTDANANQTLVKCELRASHLTGSTTDPKEACRKAYGDEVVVHVRAPDPSVATLNCKSTALKCQGVPWDYQNLISKQ